METKKQIAELRGLVGRAQIIFDDLTEFPEFLDEHSRWSTKDGAMIWRRNLKHLKAEHAKWVRRIHAFERNAHGEG